MHRVASLKSFNHARYCWRARCCIFHFRNDDYTHVYMNEYIFVCLLFVYIFIQQHFHSFFFFCNAMNGWGLLRFIARVIVQDYLLHAVFQANFECYFNPFTDYFDLPKRKWIFLVLFRYSKTFLSKFSTLMTSQKSVIWTFWCIKMCFWKKMLYKFG
jgi:hypothetical protein